MTESVTTLMVELVVAFTDIRDLADEQMVEAEERATRALDAGDKSAAIYLRARAQAFAEIRRMVPASIGGTSPPAREELTTLLFADDPPTTSWLG
jgi:hypothetical protein